MSMQLVLPQMTASAERACVACGEAAGDLASEETVCPRHGNEDTGSALLRAALTRGNLQAAFKRVRTNKGAAGVDGLDIDQTAHHLVDAWPGIREELLAGTYRPSPVRRVMILKPDGSQRELGIPTVTDRLIVNSWAIASGSRPKGWSRERWRLSRWPRSNNVFGN